MAVKLIKKDGAYFLEIDEAILDTIELREGEEVRMSLYGKSLVIQANKNKDINSLILENTTSKSNT